MSFREFTSKFAGGRGNPPLQHSRAHPLFIMQLFPCRPLRVVILRQQPKNLVSHLLHFALFEILRFAQDDKLFAQDDKLKFSQKKQGHFPYSENALSFCIYNLFCCTSGADCASNPNARHSAREIADNLIPVRVCGFAENRRADCDGLQYGPVRGGNPIQIPVQRAEDQGVAVQNRCASTVCALPIYGAVPTNALPTGVSHKILCAANRQKRQKARAHSRCFFLNIY